MSLGTAALLVLCLDVAATDYGNISAKGGTALALIAALLVIVELLRR